MMEFMFLMADRYDLVNQIVVISLYNNAFFCSVGYHLFLSVFLCLYYTKPPQEGQEEFKIFFIIAEITLTVTAFPRHLYR